MPNNLVGSAMGNGATQSAPAAVSPGAGNQLAAAAGAPPQQMPGAPASPATKQVQLSEAKDVLRKQGAIDRQLKGLLKEPGPVKRKQVIDVAVNLVAERIMSPQEMAGYLADLPEDGMQIRQWVVQHAKNVEQGLDQLIGMVHGVDAQQPAAGMTQQ